MMPERPKIEVETKVVRNPAGELGVLFQLPHGYVIMSPNDARNVAWNMVELADEIDRMNPAGDKAVKMAAMAGTCPKCGHMKQTKLGFDNDCACTYAGD